MKVYLVIDLFFLILHIFCFYRIYVTEMNCILCKEIDPCEAVMGPQQIKLFCKGTGQLYWKRI